MSASYYNTHLKESVEYKEKKAAYDRRYREINREKIKQKGIAYREKNFDRLKIEKAQWSKDNREVLKQRWNKQVLMYRFGLTPMQYDIILEQQRGVCAICGEFRLASNQVRMGVDHCHETEKVRGILCNWCNTSIGHFGDSIEVLLKAIEYLKSNGSHLNIGEVADPTKYSNGTRNMRYTRIKKIEIT